jgi:26S proteasome non-ATPase regulatory subunit 9
MGYQLPSPPNAAAEHARSLITKKDTIQQEMEAQLAILTSNSCTIQTALIDAQGFPRADIDVFAVRHARVRIIELRNDLAAIMDEIAKALENVYRPDETAKITITREPDSDTELRPFARVDGIAPRSPAAECGLMPGDAILRFGHLTSKSFASNSLQPIAELVASHENRPVEMLIRRTSNTPITLSFIPRQGWGGRGMLGCHIVPFADS